MEESWFSGYAMQQNDSWNWVLKSGCSAKTKTTVNSSVKKEKKKKTGCRHMERQTQE